MEHPLITNLESLTTDELSSTVSSLHKKLGIAVRSGNAHLCEQIRMAIESYQNRYQVLMQAEYAKQDKANIDRYNSKIDIS